MEYSSQDITWIDQFLNNELIGEELDRFKLKLKNDPDFKRQVETQKLLVEGVKKARHEELKQLLQTKGEVKYFQNMWGQQWMYASAAIVAVFVIAFVLIKFYGPEVDMISGEQPLAVEETQEPESPETFSESSNGNSQIAAIDSNPLTVADKTDTTIELETPKMVEIEEISLEDQDINTTDTRLESERDSKTPRSMQMAKETAIDSESEEVPEEAIKRDRMISSTAFNAQIYSTEIKEVETGEKKGIFNRKQTAEKETLSASGQKQIKVEQWKSVLNYKGYKYSNNKLTLYGLSEKAQPKFIEKDGQLYMKVEQNTYKIQPNSDFSSYQKVNDAQVDSLFNQ